MSSRGKQIRCRYALESGREWMPLPPGETVIGRAEGCEIVIDHPLISRRHARLTVTDVAVFIEDLGSANGVRVDGKPIEGKTLIAAGARIGIGEASMRLTLANRDADASTTARMPTRDAEELGPKSDGQITRRTNAFRLIAGVVDKALALGQPEEAERLLGGLLQDVLVEAQRGRDISPEIAESAAHSALKLAGATRRPQWSNYAIRLYSALGRMLPLPLIDELYALSHRAASMDLTLLQSYVDALTSKALSRSERFALQRIQNFARMVASR